MSATRCRAIRQYSFSVSMPTYDLPRRLATIAVVPDPTNGSSTTSPGWVNSLINHSGSASGNVAGCCLLPHSVARCSTLVGYALSRPNQGESAQRRTAPLRPARSSSACAKRAGCGRKSSSGTNATPTRASGRIDSAMRGSAACSSTSSGTLRCIKRRS